MTGPAAAAAEMLSVTYDCSSAERAAARSSSCSLIATSS